MLDESKKTSHYEKRFGIIAIEKGFISQDELIHALTVQVREDIENGVHRLIGELFFDLNIMHENEIEEVVKEITRASE
jgi:hypothetical protein